MKGTNEELVNAIVDCLTKLEYDAEGIRLTFSNETIDEIIEEKERREKLTVMEVTK